MSEKITLSPSQRIADLKNEEEILFFEASVVGAIGLISLALSVAPDKVMEFISNNPEQAHTIAEFSNANAQLMAVTALAAFILGIKRHGQIQELSSRQLR
jgi:dihydrodipicolinate synthase/N-acetylneuraminate lyase